MSNILANLQLRDYSLLALSIEANPNFKLDESKPVRSNLGVSFNVFTKENEAQFKLVLDIHVNPDDADFKKSEYRIRVKLESYFDFDESFKGLDISKILIPNGLAMSYSTVRGIVGQVTGSALHGKFLLPSINFIELIKEKIEQEKVKEEKQIRPKAKKLSR